jgi:GTP-binding protein EngB required for normal cell division
VELEEYLVSRSNLAGLSTHDDIRHPIKFFWWAGIKGQAGDLPVHILLTKADNIMVLQKRTTQHPQNIKKNWRPVLRFWLFSALRKKVRMSWLQSNETND